MNLDDFLVPNSIASPAGITPSPEVTHLAPPGNSRVSALPIQPRHLPTHHSIDNLPAASVPHPSTISNRTGEFDYVQRRVRKTSIDERRVRYALSATYHNNPCLVC